MSYKSFSLLTALSRRRHVNLATTIFGNINLTETVIDLIADEKFNQK